MTHLHKWQTVYRSYLRKGILQFASSRIWIKTEEGGFVAHDILICLRCGKFKIKASAHAKK